MRQIINSDSLTHTSSHTHTHPSTCIHNQGMYILLEDKTPFQSTSNCEDQSQRHHTFLSKTKKGTFRAKYNLIEGQLPNLYIDQAHKPTRTHFTKHEKTRVFRDCKCTLQPPPQDTTASFPLESLTNSTHTHKHEAHNHTPIPI